jgi:hypothetical protein
MNTAAELKTQSSMSARLGVGVHPTFYEKLVMKPVMSAQCIDRTKLVPSFPLWTRLYV